MAVPPVLADLVSAPNAPTRSGRGGRDRRSKFYELSDNLQGAPIRGDAIILRPGARRMLLGDCERLGNAACARSLEPEPIIGKWLRISEGLPSGACWPALVRLTPGGVGFCNRRGAAVWPAPARRLLRLLNCATLLGRAAAATLLLPFRTSGVRRARSASDAFRSPCQQQSVGRRTARSRLVQLAPLSSIVGISASTPPPIAGARAVGGRQADPSRRGADRGRARGRACRERAVPGTEPALGRRPIIIGCRSSSPARSGPRTGSRWPSRTCSTRPGSSRRTARSCSPSAEHVPERTAESVARLEAAGYATVGKTNLHEFAYGISSQNPAFRDRAEPGRAGRLASSSSGGSAAALAAGLADAALGTDSGG